MQVIHRELGLTASLPDPAHISLPGGGKQLPSASLPTGDSTDLEWTIASPAVQLSAAHRAKAAHSSPITGFLSGNRHSLMITCFWVCLMKLSLCNCSRKKCMRRAGTAYCRTSRQHRAGGFDHTAVLVLAHVLSATRSTTSLVSSLKSRGFREAVQCLCAGTPPKTQKTRTFPSLHLCALMKGHSIPNTLLSGTDTTSSQH